MVAIVDPSSHLTIPTGLVEVDWRHPLAEGLLGAWMFNQICPPDLVTGNKPAIVGTALKHGESNAASKGITFGGASNLQYGAGYDVQGQAYTIATRCRPLGDAGGAGIFSDSYNASPDNTVQYSLGVSQDQTSLTMNNFMVGHYTGSGWVKAQDPTAYVRGQTYSIAGAVNASLMQLYKDGRQVASVASTAIPSKGTGALTYLGRRHDNNGTNYFPGVVDYIWFWNKSQLEDAIREIKAAPYQFLRKKQNRKWWWMTGNAAVVNVDFTVSAINRAITHVDATTPAGSRASAMAEGAMPASSLSAINGDTLLLAAWAETLRADSAIDARYLAALAADHALSGVWRGAVIVNADAPLGVVWRGNLAHAQTLPSLMRAQITADHSAPSGWFLGLRTDHGLPVVFSSGVASDAMLPLLWRGGVLVEAAQEAPIRWRAVAAADQPLPALMRAQVNLEHATPVGWLSSIVADRFMPSSWGADVRGDSAGPFSWRSSIAADEGLAAAWSQPQPGFVGGVTDVWYVDARGVVWEVPARDVVWLAEKR